MKLREDQQKHTYGMIVSLYKILVHFLYKKDNEGVKQVHFTCFYCEHTYHAYRISFDCLHLYFGLVTLLGDRLVFAVSTVLGQCP